MKFLQRSAIVLVLISLSMPAYATSAALAPYTDNPLVEFLAAQRYHVVLGLQADTASNDHDVLSLVAGIGYFPREQLAVGIYGTMRNSDRRIPTIMRQMYGFGLFSEYHFDPQAAVQPFVGGRLGLIDTTGINNPTSVHAAALGGFKFAINKNMALSTAAVFNWAKEDILDYDNAKAKGSNTDLGIEISLRFGF